MSARLKNQLIGLEEQALSKLTRDPTISFITKTTVEILALNLREWKVKEVVDLVKLSENTIRKTSSRWIIQGIE